MNKGYQKIVDGDFGAALENFNKAIELDPNNTEAYNSRGVIFGIVGQHDRAIEDFNRALELNPSDPEAYNYRGIAKLHLKQTDSGCLDLITAKDLGYAEAYKLVEQFCAE